MGRQQRNTVDYFPHDAEPGKTLFILKSRYGNNGYAFWFQLLEVLCKEENHFYDCNNEAAWQYLLARTGVDEQTGIEILKILSNLGKIDPEMWQKKIIWCEKLVLNFADVYKKRGRNPPPRPSLLNNNSTTVPTKPISGTEITISGTETPQSKVNKSKLLPLKVDSAKRSPPPQEKRGSIVNEIFADMRAFFGFPDKLTQDPIPNYGKEGQAIKRMLARGFTREAIVLCWKSKVSRRGGEFVSMTWVNEDIGKPEKPKRGPKQLSTEAEITASIQGVKS